MKLKLGANLNLVAKWKADFDCFNGAKLWIAQRYVGMDSMYRPMAAILWDISRKDTP